jgi:hypothetical protein
MARRARATRHIVLAQEHESQTIYIEVPLKGLLAPMPRIMTMTVEIGRGLNMATTWGIHDSVWTGLLKTQGITASKMTPCGYGVKDCGVSLGGACLLIAAVSVCRLWCLGKAWVTFQRYDILVGNHYLCIITIAYGEWAPLCGEEKVSNLPR